MLALSASSPAWNGEDTGYAQPHPAVPPAAHRRLPPDVRDWESWQAYMADQWKSGVINPTGSMRIDIRPASVQDHRGGVADAVSNPASSPPSSR